VAVAAAPLPSTSYEADAPRTPPSCRRWNWTAWIAAITDRVTKHARASSTYRTVFNSRR